MRKNKDEINSIVESMKEQIGEENLLEELLTALNIDELNENLEHIDQMYDLGNFE